MTDKESRKREADERGLKYEEEDDSAEEEQRLKKKKKRVKLESSSEDEESEDEDDSEDEDKTASARKRKKKKAPRNKGFFVDEASEGSSEDEENEIELGEDEAADILTPAQKERLDQRHAAGRRLRDEAAEVLAAELDAKYKSTAVGPKNNVKFSGHATMGEARVLRDRPRTEDPKLFMVKCKPGEEKQLVVKLYAKYIHNKFKKPEPIDPNAPKSRWSLPPPVGAELEIFSILAPGTTGYIYVEAMREECVKAAVRGVSGVFSGNTTIVPLEEMTDVLRVELRKDVIRKDDYVRMRGPFPYRGDLARVYSVQDGGNKLTVRIVPRIDLSTLSMDYSSKDRQRTIPPAKLFNPDEIRAAGGTLGREQYQGEMFDTFENHFFDNGLLLLEVNQRQVQALSDKPSLEELEKFVTPSSSNDSMKTEITAIAEEVQKSLSKQKKDHYDFAVGDKVMAISGAEAGVQGTLENIDLLRGIGVVKNATQGLVIDVQLKDLVKYFTVGDHVKILVGKHAGKTGNVVSVPKTSDQRPYVLVYTDFGGEEIQVFNSDMKISSEVSVGLESLNGYRLFDLVMLDQNQHGIIVRVNSDTVRILTQNGEAKEVPTTTIRAKKNHESKHASALDMTQHSLSCQDHIIVTAGPFKGSEGMIKHIYRTLLFIHCKAREQENSGVIVVKSKEVRIAGSLMQKPAGFGMRPTLRGGPGGGAAARHKDEMVGKTVRIRKGNDKGLLGTVVEGGSATALRVELNARNRIIIVPRDNLVVEEVKSIFEPQPAVTDDVRNYRASVPSSAPMYPTPMYDFSESRPARSSQLDGIGGGRPQFRKNDSVKLIDSGESVKVYEVIDRDIVVIGADNKMKIVSASNVVYA